ncbi:hypothetical protein BD414DRAFT_488867 [Trametes punicea]|nr:hypothetical protein BD414DRAFT_488867 [Trametes punicea]
MSAQYDLPRPADHLPRGAARLHMANKPTSYHISHMEHGGTRRIPVVSSSLPQTSWLSDVAEFNPVPPSQNHLGVSATGSDSLLSVGSVSDSGPPSSSLHRARSRDYLPSSRMSVQSSGSGPLSRRSPVPPSRTLHASRSFSSTSPLKASAFSDRDASGHLDFKRLMSKPAKQSAPAPSMVSLPSDSEPFGSASSSRLVPSRRPSTSASIPSPPLARSTNPSREKLSLQVTTSGPHSNAAHQSSQGSSAERRPGTSEGQAVKATRNVLRRRPSARSNPGTPTVASFQVAKEETLSGLRSAPSNPPSSLDHPTRSSSARPSTSPSHPAATLPRKMSASTSSKDKHSPVGLTPAGAVALAYKQQEQRREELAESVLSNDARAYKPSSIKAPSLPMHHMDIDVPADEVAEEGGEPYYTVFGSSSGRLVAVGSPGDDDWHFSGWNARAAIAVGNKPASRSLSRKVSGSFKRVAESIKRDKEPRGPLERTKGMDDWRPYDGSCSVSGRDSPSRVKMAPKPLSLDMTTESKSSPRASPIGRGSASPKSSSSPQEDDRSSHASKSKNKDPSGEHSPGGIFSKLMKRISSSSALREKYHKSDEPPPPVPALPQNITKEPVSRTTMEVTPSHAHGEDVGENGLLLRRFMQSRSSMSGVRPFAAPTKTPSPASSRPSTGTAGRPSTGNTNKSRASLGNRPSTTTGSSSPVSSEVASSGFYNNRTPSTRSSISSLGEEIPPMPKHLGQYILPPSELSRMTKTSDGSLPVPSRRTRSNRAQSVVGDFTHKRSPEEVPIPSLPLPPRRITHEGSSGSPLSSSFSGDDINHAAGGSYSPPLAEFGMKEPPPRPKRSARRALPSHMDLPPRSQSMSASMPRSPVTPRAPPAVRVNVDLTRHPSTGALSYASTAKQTPTSSTSPSSGAPYSASPSSAASQQRSPLTFRELESPRQKLSEQEKAAKWEDLLERSARAGGTLHIGDSGLLSEHPDTTESISHGSSSDA